MTNKTLIAQNSVVQAYPIQNFPGSDTIRIVQFNPQVGIGFSGSVVIEESIAAVPGDSSFTPIMTVTFTAHTQNIVVEVNSTAPAIRARITSSQQGAIAVFADSANRAIQGASCTGAPHTAIIDSPRPAKGSGSNFKINTTIVNGVSSDDVVYEGFTLTDVLDGTNGAPGKQDKIGTGVITANEADINVLTGANAYGLTTVDMQRVADTNASATELNRVIGVTSNVQDQIDTINSTLPSTIAGLTTEAATIDAFFDTAAIVTVDDLNTFAGLTSSAADLNVFTGTAGSFTAADLTLLGNINASASEINSLSGFTGTSTDLNGIVGLTTSTADINAVAGLAGTGVTATEFTHLSGLTQNVQTFIDSVPTLTGLTATVTDLNILTGAFSGSGAYSGPISATEISYLNGLVGNIQTQLNDKRSSAVSIGVTEISGASITTTELNYLQGTTSNVQAQIDALTLSSITSTGGTFTAPVYISNGSAAAPGLGFATPNNSTGFYLFGANGIGMSVAGTRFLSQDGTDMVVGTGAANGSPTLKGVGMSASDPAYSFTGDTNTGIYWAGADSVGIAAGAESMATFDAANDQITMGGSVANNNQITMTGMFDGMKLLGRAAVQAGSVSGATGQTVLYTVPAGRNALVTAVYVRLTNVTNFTDGSLMRMNIGFGAGFDEIVDNTSNTTIFNPGGYSFDTALQVMPLGTGDNTFPAISGSSGADYQIMVAGAILNADVTVVAGADDFDMEIIVMGHEFA